MFQLAYNIDFEVYALIMTIFLYGETCVHYPGKTHKNRIFRVMVLMVILTEVFDLASAVAVTYGAQIPHMLNMIINSGYFMLGLVLSYLLQYYLQRAFVPEDGKSIFLRANKYILIVMELSFIPNLFLGYYFTISPQGDYLRGSFYLLQHLVSCWFILCASATLLFNHKIMKKSQLFSGCLFILLYFVAVLLQTFWFSDIYIIMPAVSIMLLVVVFSLESPDFMQLQRTLEELSRTKQELESANEKLVNLAYVDLMTGLKNRTSYVLQVEEIEAAESAEDIIFLLADVNDLKYLNDTYGHFVGDDAIIQTAKLLEQSFGEPCQCFRLGGDEFAVIAKGISEQEFQCRYQQFVDAVQQVNETVHYPFAVAAGYQMLAQGNLADVQRKADENMYADKIKQKTNQ